MKTINRNRLSTASCLSLLITSLSFGIHASIPNRHGVQFNADASPLRKAMGQKS